MSTGSHLQPIRLPLVTLTPLFLGGADPRGDPELRASSFRGALRFWLRALLGGCHGTDDAGLAEVRRIEAETFGEAGGERETGASPIIVRVRETETPERDKGTEVKEFSSQRVELRYLWYGVAASGRQQRARRCIVPLSTFMLELEPRAGAKPERVEKALHRALLATWLLIHFGGVGARARRAAGCLGVAFRPRVVEGGQTRFSPVQIGGYRSIYPETSLRQQNRLVVY